MKPRYKRMLDALAEGPASGPKEWEVYLVRCRDGSLYTGIAKNAEERVQKHNDGKGAAYTRSRRPVRLVHREEGFTRSEALVREARIKTLGRPGKEALLFRKDGK